MEHLLDELSELQAAKAVLEMEKQRLIDSVLTEEIKNRLNEIDIEFSDKLEAVDQEIEAVTEKIKKGVLEEGKTVKGTYLTAIYAKGRESVDMKKFAGYAVAHPEVARFIKVGQPSVSIRRNP